MTHRDTSLIITQRGGDVWLANTEIWVLVNHLSIRHLPMWINPRLKWSHGKQAESSLNIEER